MYPGFHQSQFLKLYIRRTWNLQFMSPSVSLNPSGRKTISTQFIKRLLQKVSNEGVNLLVELIKNTFLNFKINLWNVVGYSADNGHKHSIDIVSRVLVKNPSVLSSLWAVWVPRCWKNMFPATPSRWSTAGASGFSPQFWRSTQIKTKKQKKPPTIWHYVWIKLDTVPTHQTWHGESIAKSEWETLQLLGRTRWSVLCDTCCSLSFHVSSFLMSKEFV